MKIKIQNQFKKKKSLPYDQPRTKSKSKSKSKNPNKKFNPVQYLNALIQLTNEKDPLKVKRNNPSGKRDLSSALTIATPAMQKTISSSKIRCKSSYSQYRKKSTNGLKQVLKIKLQNVITEQQQNHIKFTSISSASHQNSPQNNKAISIYPYKSTFSINQNVSAKKIQRAWRSYLTYKMVHKYYKHFKKVDKKTKKHQLVQHNKKQNKITLNPYHQQKNDVYFPQIIESIQQHQKVFLKTLKIKIKKSQSIQQKINLKIQVQPSEDDDLDLTQKLNMIKQFVDNLDQIDSHNEQEHSQFIQQIPTIEIRKNYLPYYNQQNINSFDSKLVLSQSQSTQKKKNNIMHNTTEQKVKKLKQQYKNNKKQEIKQQKRKTISTQIQKQTQRYDSVLLWINQACSQSQPQSKQSLLLQLLNRLQQNKTILQKDISLTSGKENSILSNNKINVFNLIQKQNKSNNVILIQQQNKSNTFIPIQQNQSNTFTPLHQKSCKQDNSQNMICFDSKEIYQFESVQSSNIKQTPNKHQQNQPIQDQDLILGQSVYEFQKRLENQQIRLDLLSNQNYHNMVKQFQSVSDSNSSIKIQQNHLNHSFQNQDNQFYAGIENINLRKNNKNKQTYQQQDSSDESSIYSLCENTKQKKLFLKHIQLLTKRKNNQLQKVSQLFFNKILNKQKYNQKVQNIQDLYKKQKNQLQRKQIKYLAALKSIRKQAVNFQKSLLTNSAQKSQSNQDKQFIRKSFSSGSIVLKCILAQTTFLDFDISRFAIKQQQISIQPQQQIPTQTQIPKYQIKIQQQIQKQQQQIQKQQQQIQKQQSQILTQQIKAQKSQQDNENSQILLQSIDFINSQNQKQQIDMKHIKQCSQQVEKIIQNQLIDQILQQIYLNQNLLKQFKPFIQQIFQFTPMTDQKIKLYLIELKKFFPIEKQLLKKANQNINPTSLEILKLIRDFDFQISQYELILSQEIFRSSRRAIQQQYQKKAQARKQIQMIPKTNIQNLQLIDKMYLREMQKASKVDKYMNYQRDLKIMYCKSIFNCLNQLLIQQKSISTHMNTRSTIGTGTLSLAIKQFNQPCYSQGLIKILNQSNQRLQNIVRNKCMMPSFKNYKDVQIFQKQMLKIIKHQIQESQYKWVNYMDQVLEMWYQLSNFIINTIFQQLMQDLFQINKKIF